MLFIIDVMNDFTSIRWSVKWTNVWRVSLPISSQFSNTILPRNIRKPLFFGCFQMA